MQHEQLINYLSKKFPTCAVKQDEDGFIVTTVYFNGNDTDRITLFVTDDMVGASLFAGVYQDKHIQAVRAFIDNNNESCDALVPLSLINNQLWCNIDIPCSDDEKAIGLIERLVGAFIGDDGIVARVDDAIKTRQSRDKLVKARIKSVLRRVSKFESEGKHASAMDELKELARSYPSYFDMGTAAMYYKIPRFSAPDAPMPIKEDYQLDCFVESFNTDEGVFLAPTALRYAKKLGRDNLAKQIVEIGQRLGAWEVEAFRRKDETTQILKRIAQCYRRGVGCKKSELYANYYDRLASGEIKQVLLDMLKSNYKGVFNLMTRTVYCKIKSLSELDGVSEKFRNAYLYGDTDSDNDRGGFPEWFVPLLNGLNATDREVVLNSACDKLTATIDEIIAKVDSGEYDVTSPLKESGYIQLRAYKSRSYYFPDLAEVEPSEGRDRFRAQIKRLCALSETA